MPQTGRLRGSFHDWVVGGTWADDVVVDRKNRRFVRKTKREETEEQNYSDSENLAFEVGPPPKYQTFREGGKKVHYQCRKTPSWRAARRPRTVSDPKLDFSGEESQGCDAGNEAEEHGEDGGADPHPEEGTLYVASIETSRFKNDAPSCGASSKGRSRSSTSGGERPYNHVLRIAGEEHQRLRHAGRRKHVMEDAGGQRYFARSKGESRRSMGLFL